MVSWRDELPAPDALYQWRFWRVHAAENVGQVIDYAITARSYGEVVVAHALAGHYDPMPDDVVQLLMEVTANNDQIVTQ
jgi:hypothetical protein